MDGGGGVDKRGVWMIRIVWMCYFKCLLTRDFFTLIDYSVVDKGVDG